MLECRICQNTHENTAFVAREMMFGLPETFDYFECAECGCLQIVHPPEDLARYYPSNYHSFRQLNGLRQWRLRRYARRLRYQYGLGHETLAGRMLAQKIGLPPMIEWVKRAGIGFEEAVLDVGSGMGRLLLDLQDAGFSDLTGVDPFIERDLVYEGGVQVLKLDLSQVERAYDFVILHHSLEHVPDPLGTLSEVRRVLKPGRLALVRTPLADSYAWKAYGRDWIQLDAPRHLCVHTQASIRILAEQSGLEVVDVIHDSTSFQFLGSEQYRRDIPMHDLRSHFTNPSRSLFTKEEVQAFERRAAELNEAGEGDQACIYLRRT